MTRIFNDIINLFYPHLCLICKKPLLEGEKHICLDCICNLPHPDFHNSKNNQITALFAGYPQINEAIAYMFFEKDGKVQNLTHEFKYHNNKELAEYLGHTAALELKNLGIFADVETIIPIPLHPKKKKSRGYNQSEYIARGISSVYNYPIDTTSLQRTTFTQTQTKKSIYDRHVNVEKIFSLSNAEALYGKHILLVDDVITTGATTSACIEALTDISGIKISIFALSVAKNS